MLAESDSAQLPLWPSEAGLNYQLVAAGTPGDHS